MATINANPIATPVGAAPAAAASAAAATKTSGFGGDFNTYLTLLTTQLKNQDPTKAMDAQQMTAQLVQFAQVEQSISLNASVTKLIGLQEAAQLTAAAPLLGRTVEVASDRLSLQSGTATLKLPPAGAAREALVTVLDAAGQPLREATVPLGTTGTTWRWDGRNAAGQPVPDGAYRFAVAGRDSNGGPQPVEVTVLARATAAERQTGASGELQLVLGGLAVGFDKVRSLQGS